ncbi:hypothetical protein NEOLEDRAFT_1128620 [Neolentinus lepideus HHB14362 ss-1]|uniref:Uncharacterized protein n=1 Tax=Neolentinus lepideus HHB14362 ss-1 TaxID=1314782 RepID=A0A165V323_9AGAM|nr:hypothetical protein NEOLEDRAFT_1128620 [Neolentinus lepideus HHB14362 ss-1]
MPPDRPPNSPSTSSPRAAPKPRLTPAQAIVKAWRSQSSSSQNKWREADAKARAQFSDPKPQRGREPKAKM